MRKIEILQLIILLAFMLINISTFAQRERKYDKINRPGQHLLLAGDNAITGLALQTLGAFIVISDFKTHNPNSQNTIKGIGYGFIGVGTFYYVKAYIRLRKAGKMLSYNDNDFNNHYKKQNFDFNISTNSISLCFNF